MRGSRCSFSFSFNVLLTLLSPAKTMLDMHKRIFMSAIIDAETGYLIKWSISAIFVHEEISSGVC